LYSIASGGRKSLGLALTLLKTQAPRSAGIQALDRPKKRGSRRSRVR
jgi:hypothetical protein